MSVFTAFFCGTCSNSYDFIDGEVVATLARNHPGREFVDWVICDGPGSGVHKSDEAPDLQKAQGRWHNGVSTPMMKALGIQRELATEPGKAKTARNLDLGMKWTEPGDHWRLTAIANGAGWEENVAHVVAVIRGEAERTSGGALAPQKLQEQQVRMFRKGSPVTRVNAIGWSRGAVSCHMLANALAKDPRLSQIEINIFAIDPVPGPGEFDAHRVQLPRTVRNYFAVYARHELQRIFRPTLPAFEGDCRPRGFRTVLMPGVHATPSGDPYVRRHTQRASGKVTRHLAEQCLAEWGTPLNQRLNYDDLRLLAKYDDMLLHDVDYRRKDKDKVKKADAQRTIEVRVGNKNKATLLRKVPEFRTNEELGVFVNWHHREVFERLFRMVANRVYGPDRFRPDPSVGYRIGMTHLAQMAPQLYSRLLHLQAA
jgi:hypothetical protein